MSSDSLYESRVPSLELLHRGKVIAAPEVRGMESFFAEPIAP